MARKRICCIYRATNLINGKIYIGSTIDFYRRKSEHLSNKNNCPKFKKALTKYGVDAFSWDILEEIEPNELTEKEQFYLDKLLFAQDYLNKKNDLFERNGYNICPTAYSSLGKKVLDTSRIRKRMVSAFDLNGNFVKNFESIRQASKELGDKEFSINNCCINKLSLPKNNSRKYIYRYFDGKSVDTKSVSLYHNTFKYYGNKNRAKMVVNIQTGVIYDNIGQAAKENNIKESTLTYQLRHNINKKLKYYENKN